MQTTHHKQAKNVTIVQIADRMHIPTKNPHTKPLNDKNKIKHNLDSTRRKIICLKKR